MPHSDAAGLAGRRILVCITGGIAVYKACEVVRGLIKAGASVQVAMTAHAQEFVSALTFETLSGRPVAVTEWAPGPGGPIPHIELTRESDLMIVLPATANILAKAAHGVADDLVSTLICARRTPVVFIPAMNVRMWRNPATARNVKALKAAGCAFIGPAEGFQACGDTGAGRMSEPAEILDRLSGFFAPKILAGRRVVVTAGPTYEAIDRVRGLTNRSSGRQGYAIARAARDAGADVTLVSGPTALPPPFGVETVRVASAREMLAAVEAALAAKPADLFFAVAAVADWRPAEADEGKLKKAPGANPLAAVEWTENPDILRTVAESAARSGGQPLAIGFAAECAEGEDLLALAREKRRRKGAAFICANDARFALESGRNAVRLVGEDEEAAFGPADKAAVARFIVAAAAKALEGRPIAEAAAEANEASAAEDDRR